MPERPFDADERRHRSDGYPSGAWPQAAAIALQDGAGAIGFEAFAGEIVRVVGGPALARRSLLAQLADAKPPPGGGWQLFGHDLQTIGAAALRERAIGRALRHDRLLPSSSLLANIALPLAAQSAARPGLAVDAAHELEVFGLADAGHLPAARLTPSQHRRGLIARALATRPPLVVLEHPEVDLLPREIERVALALWAVAAGHAACVLLSTDSPALAALAEREFRLDRRGWRDAA
jgi:predicted ABC-type transport system involved in lysophospholipase L1 biosynthesis ATPase subunit